MVNKTSNFQPTQFNRQPSSLSPITPGNNSISRSGSQPGDIGDSQLLQMNSLGSLGDIDAPQMNRRANQGFSNMSANSSIGEGDLIGQFTEFISKIFAAFSNYLKNNNQGVENDDQIGGDSPPTSGQTRSDSPPINGGGGSLPQTDKGPSKGAASPGTGVNESFVQGSQGNCCTIATIKAAFDKFGADDLLKKKKSGDGYDVTLKNGNTVHVSQAELNLAKQKSDFKPGAESKSGAVPEDAYLAYAVMAKQEQRAEGGSLDEAMDRLNNGKGPETTAAHLGLRIKETSVDQAVNSEGGMVFDDDHAMQAREGKVDIYGEEVNDEHAAAELKQNLNRGVILTE